MAKKPSAPDLPRRLDGCRRCPRLRTYCTSIAQTKRRAYREETYWGKPVPSFGDSRAGLLVVGLAPAAHGANRTGRMFTGDQSGLWLYRALHRAGFSNQALSIGPNDGLTLKGAYITAVTHCAPPANKPFPEEKAQCREYLEEELMALTSVRVIMTLGHVAYQSVWELARLLHWTEARAPRFRHGGVAPLGGGRSILMSYHPSQQNTFTRRLTEPMFDSVFQKARELMSGSPQAPA